MGKIFNRENNGYHCLLKVRIKGGAIKPAPIYEMLQNLPST